MAECFGEHKYVFLRQEERKEGHVRDPEYVTEDVFFCQSCLKHERRELKRERNDTLTFGRVRIR